LIFFGVFGVLKYTLQGQNTFRPRWHHFDLPLEIADRFKDNPKRFPVHTERHGLRRPVERQRYLAIAAAQALSKLRPKPALQRIHARRKAQARVEPLAV